MRSILRLGLAGLMLLAAAGALYRFWWGPDDLKQNGQVARGGSADDLHWETWNIGGPPARIDASALPRDRPPPLDALRDANRQAEYDTQAAPGDYVTPPIVSQPH
jgi:hypothetical protein